MNIEEYGNTSHIKEIISSRKKKTNSFYFYNEICDWLDSGKADAYLVGNNVFLFFRSNGFYKFYYYVESFEDIRLAQALLDKYREKSQISLEFTTKNNKFLEEIKEVVYSIGFEFYAEFARLLAGINKLEDEKKNKKMYFDMFELAILKDKDELLKIIYQEFDKIKDNIPTENELIDLINQKAILIRKIENEIIYIQIYEYSYGVLYSRMTWIKKEYRKPEYTIEFFNAADNYVEQLNIENKNIRSYFWVDTSIRNYKITLKLGATLDGLTSNIFVYKN